MTRSQRARRSPYLWALPATFFLMLFALVNAYPVFFIDSRSYVRSAALATDSIIGTSFGEPWGSTAGPGVWPEDGGPGSALAGGVPGATGENTAPPLARPPEPSIDVRQNGGQPVNNGITANRSIYYGFIAFLGYASSDFWLLIIAQGYVTASCMAIMALRVVDIRPAAYLGIVALISLLTCVGPFVAYVMPDIFGATIILGAVTILLGWHRLTVFDRLYLSAVVGFSSVAHNSNVLLLAAIFGAWLIWMLATRGLARRIPQAVTLLILCAVGPIGLAAFSFVIERQTGEAPLVIPHITAHLVDLGPGTAYVKQHCPDNEFAVCEYRDVLPVTWTEFIGGARDEERGVFAVADLPTKRRLSNEQIAFAAAVWRTYPLETTLGLLRDGAYQLGTLSLIDMKVDATLQKYFRRYMPPSVWLGISGSMVYSHPGVLDVITVLAYISSLAGLFYIVWFLYRGAASRYKGNEFLAGAIALLLVAIITNAAICGILASPMGRFSARLIWLLPFTALLVAFAKPSYRWHRTPDPSAPDPV